MEAAAATQGVSTAKQGVPDACRCVIEFGDVSGRTPNSVCSTTAPHVAREVGIRMLGMA